VQINDLLAQMGGLQSMASELGMTEQQAASGAAALLPAILGGLNKQAQAAPAGMDGLGSLLGQLGGGGLLDQVLSPQATNTAPGNDVLGQIFGSKDVSRAVAGNAAAQTGLDAALLKKMLPMLAMVVAGFFAKQHASAAAQAAPGAQSPGLGDLGGLGGLLGGLLGGGGGAGGATAGLGGLGSLAGMLDANGDGNPLDDILRMVGQARR